MSAGSIRRPKSATIPRPFLAANTTVPKSPAHNGTCNSVISHRGVS
jgi:hypothetical protein